MHDRIGAERGWPPMARASFEQEVERGALHVGAPETVARKIAKTAKALGIVRFDLKYRPARWRTTSSCTASSFMAPKSSHWCAR